MGTFGRPCFAKSKHRLSEKRSFSTVSRETCAVSLLHKQTSKEKVVMIPTPEQAWELLCEYNEGDFHRKHGRIVGDACERCC